MKFFRGFKWGGDATGPVTERRLFFARARWQTTSRLAVAMILGAVCGVLFGPVSLALASTIVESRLPRTPGVAPLSPFRHFSVLSHLYEITAVIVVSIAVCIIYPSLARWAFDFKARRHWLRLPHRHGVPRRSKRVLLCLVVSPLALAALFAMTYPRAVGLILVGAVILTFPKCAPVWFAHMMAARKGFGLHCVDCSYRFWPRRKPLPCCPECGRAWLEPWGLVAGERRVRKGALWLGSIIILAVWFGSIALFAYLLAGVE